MAGIGAYILGGALSGAGQGMAEDWSMVQEAALAKLKSEDAAALEEQKQANKLELKGFGRGIGGGRRSSGGAPKPEAASEEGSAAGVSWEDGKPYADPGARVVSRYKAEDGTWRGFVGGQEVYLRGPDQQDIKGGNKDRNPELAPKVATDAPGMAPPPSNVPAGAVDMLKGDPTPDAKREFDEIFGPGAAERALTS